MSYCFKAFSAVLLTFFLVCQLPLFQSVLAGPPNPGELVVSVFFNNDRLDPTVSCDKVFPVPRKIPPTKAVGRAALLELLKGPTPPEKADGYYTNLNPGVTIQRLAIKDGVARVDFSEALQHRVAGSCRVIAIRSQITQTLKQFPTVKKVIISINGRTEDILQP